MDLDGAGFSGRFLPFLRSRSLVFKAGVFREWWEGRVKAWVHFVPVDVRLGGGLWSVMAFFGGVGEAGGGGGEGEGIAEQGGGWAGGGLRKGDMGGYFFWLLLGWGGFTDGGRDEIGFQM